MANIRLKAFASSGVALSVSANTIFATYPSSGIAIVAEAQDSEIDLSASPVVTEVVYRASYEALQHEIHAIYEFLPLTVFPPQTVVTSDSIGPFAIGFNPSDTPNVTDAPTFNVGFNLPEQFYVFDGNVSFIIGPNFTESISTSDSPTFNVGANVSDTTSVSDTPAMTFTKTPFTDSVSASQNIILHPTKSVIDSTSVSDSTIEFLLGGDGGLCNGGNMVFNATPPVGEEFALAGFQN